MFYDLRKVAKTSIDPWEPTMTYFDDVHTQTMASKFAKEYSSYKFVPKKIAFLSSWVYRLDDRCTDDQQIFIGVEDYLIGKYEKHLDVTNLILIKQPKCSQE